MPKHRITMTQTRSQKTSPITCATTTSFIIIYYFKSTLINKPLHFASSRDERRNLTRFLCASRPDRTIVVTRAQRARRVPPAPPQPGSMDQGQQAPPEPQAQQAVVQAPPVPPAPPPPPPVVPAPPAPPGFALGPGRSHAVLDYDDPTTGGKATKLYNKAIAPLEAKFDG